MTSNIEVVIAPAADRDIRQILVYTDQKWGTGQRDAYSKFLFDSMNRLAVFPELGHPARYGPAGSRELVLRHHTILYRPEPSQIVILRIISHRQRRS